MIKSVLKICLVIVLLPCGASAFADTWSKEASGKLRDSCVAECGAVSVAKDKPKCPVYCGCIVEEAQKLFTEAEYVQLDRDVRIPNTYVPRWPEFAAVFPICRKKAWP